MDNPDRLRPILALWAVQVFFATFVVAGKYLLQQGLDPFAIAAIRIFFAAILLALIAQGGGREPVTRRDLALLAGLSLLGVVINQLLFIKGLELTTAVNTSLLTGTIPILTLLIAVLLRREHFDPSRVFGVGVALGGAALLLRVEAFDLSKDFTVGNLLIVLNCLSYSFYLVLSRGILQRFESRTVVAWTFLLGALIIVPIGSPSLATSAPADWTPWVWIALAWIVLGPSVGSYSLNNYALKHLHASTVAVYVFLQLLLAVSLSVLLLPGEHVTWRDASGGLLILLGVLLVSRTEALTHRSKTQTPISGKPVDSASGGPPP